MWAPAVRLVLVAAAGLTAGWFGSSYWRRRKEETADVEEDEGQTPSPSFARSERRIHTLVWCEKCHAHMALDHGCVGDAEVRNAV